MLKKILNTRLRFKIKLWQALLTFLVFGVITVAILINMNNQYSSKYTDSPSDTASQVDNLTE